MSQVLVVVEDAERREVLRLSLSGFGRAGSVPADAALLDWLGGNEIAHAAELLVEGLRVQVCPAGTFQCSGGGEAVFICIRSLPAHSVASGTGDPAASRPTERDRAVGGRPSGTAAPDVGAAISDLDYLFDDSEEEGADDALFP